MFKQFLFITYLLVISTFSYSSDLENDFFWAIRQNRLIEVQELIAEGVDVNAKYKMREPAIVYAASCGYTNAIDFEIVKTLIEHGADINATDNSGENVLMSSVKVSTMHNKWGLDEIQFLVEKGVDLNTVSRHGENVLDLSIPHQDISVFRLLINKGVPINDNHLLLAISEDKYDLAELLIEKGLDINYVDEKGFTALYYAAISIPRNVEMTKLLIDRGANVNHRIGIGKDILLILAARNAGVDISKLLLEAGANVNSKKEDGETAIVIAAEELNIDIVKLLVSYGAELNIKNDRGRTPLLIFASKKMDIYDDIIRLLIESGADINVIDESGNSALTYKIEQSGTTIEDIEFLLKNGAKINKIGRKDISPICIAVDRKNLDLVKLLIKHGANINVRDAGGTPLIKSILKKNFAIIKFLVDNGSDVNMQNYDGDTPLYYALVKGFDDAVQYLITNGADVSSRRRNSIPPILDTGNETEYVKILLEHGADPNATDKDTSVTALHKAVGYWNVELVSLLISHGANVNASDNNGRTPFQYVVKDWRVNKEITEILIKNGANNAQDNKGITPLMRIVCCSPNSTTMNVIERILEVEADVNIKDKEGRTALWWAKNKSGYITTKDLIIDLLLSKGAIE